MRLEELAARFGGELVGDGSVLIERVAPLSTAAEGDIAFAASERFAAQLPLSCAEAVIVPESLKDKTVQPRIICDDPYLYFAWVSQLFNPVEAVAPGVHPAAYVFCEVPASVAIGPGATVDEGVVLGEGVVIAAGCHIGKGCIIGAHTRLYPNVSIYHDCQLGERCLVHAGAVIGSDGFGFARAGDGAWVKIPQIGRVVIGNDVEIGANTTIDRGAMDDTVIRDGVKVDNQVQIAHNVTIGENSAIAGSVGIAGSAKIGARCMLGGQAGVEGHLEIGDDILVSGCTKVSKSIRQPGAYTACLPLQKHADWIKNFAHLRHLDAMATKIVMLEKLLKEANSK